MRVRSATDSVRHGVHRHALGLEQLRIVRSRVRSRFVLLGERVHDVSRFDADHVRRRLHQHDDRLCELRRVRHELPRRRSLSVGRVRMPHWQHGVFGHVRESAERQRALRCMRNGVSRGHGLRSRDLHRGGIGNVHHRGTDHVGRACRRDVRECRGRWRRW